MPASKKKSGSTSRHNPRRSGLRIESLEQRSMFAVTGLTLGATGTLNIVGDNGPDNITVYQSSGYTVVRFTNTAGGTSEANMGNKVLRLDIRTNGGSDTVTNSTNLESTILGGAGDHDVLRGGSARDFIYGEAGTDTIYGGGGNDTIYGNGGRDSLYGEAGNDTMLGGGGLDTVNGGSDNDTLYGDDVYGSAVVDGEAAGNDTLNGVDGFDTLYGGFGQDTLYGGNQDDYLYGQDGNDTLYGNAGYDYLYGQNDNDFLDTGSTGESFDGGGGLDFNAYRTVINGATLDDISQGNATTSNSGILSAMGIAAQRGVDMASRITYQGNGAYAVSLYKWTSSGAVPTTTTVYFNGFDKYSDDPAAHFRGQEGESWTIIMNRALTQLLSSSLGSTTGSVAGSALTAITGRGQNHYNWTDASGAMTQLYNDGILDTMYAVGNARPMVVSTHFAGALDTSLFAKNQAYMVKSVTLVGYIYSPVTGTIIPQYVVTLYNPAGVDNRNVGVVSGARSSGDNNDGLITITGAEFKRSFGEVTWA